MVKNVSSTQIVTDWEAHNNAAFLGAVTTFDGILFLYDPKGLPDLLDKVDHVLVFPVENPQGIVSAIQAIMHPRIKATLVYPVDNQTDYTKIVNAVPRISTPCFAINSTAGAQLARQITRFQRDPSRNTTAATLTNDMRISKNEADTTGKYRHRLWGRLTRSPFRPGLSNANSTVNVGLVAGVSVPIVLLLIL
ncbi:hypothetical protein IWQ60_009141, partial [Tieghemiomyces parasiticus]